MVDVSDMSHMAEVQHDLVDSTVETVNMSIGFKNGLMPEDEGLFNFPSELSNHHHHHHKDITTAPSVVSSSDGGSNLDNLSMVAHASRSHTHSRANSTFDFGEYVGPISGPQNGHSHGHGHSGALGYDGRTGSISSMADFDLESSAQMLNGQNTQAIPEEWKPRRASIAGGHIPMASAVINGLAQVGGDFSAYDHHAQRANSMIDPDHDLQHHAFGGTMSGAVRAMSGALNQTNGNSTGTGATSPNNAAGVGKVRRGSSGERDHLRLVNAACRHIAAAAAATAAQAAQNAQANRRVQSDDDDSKRSSPVGPSRAGFTRPILKRKKRRGGIMGFKELAAKAGLSPWHFHRVFRSVTGLTPKAYGEACWHAVVTSGDLDNIGSATAGSATSAPAINQSIRTPSATTINSFSNLDIVGNNNNNNNNTQTRTSPGAGVPRPAALGVPMVQSSQAMANQVPATYGRIPSHSVPFNRAYGSPQGAQPVDNSTMYGTKPPPTLHSNGQANSGQLPAGPIMPVFSNEQTRALVAANYNVRPFSAAAPSMTVANGSVPSQSENALGSSSVVSAPGPASFEYPKAQSSNLLGQFYAPDSQNVERGSVSPRSRSPLLTQKNGNRNFEDGDVKVPAKTSLVGTAPAPSQVQPMIVPGGSQNSSVAPLGNWVNNGQEMKSHHLTVAAGPTVGDSSPVQVEGCTPWIPLDDNTAALAMDETVVGMEAIDVESTRTGTDMLANDVNFWNGMNGLLERDS